MDVLQTSIDIPPTAIGLSLSDGLSFIFIVESGVKHHKPTMDQFHFNDFRLTNF
jgi:hypothetical protein